MSKVAQAARDTTRRVGFNAPGSAGDVMDRFRGTYQPGAHPAPEPGFMDPRLVLPMILQFLQRAGRVPRGTPVQPMPPPGPPPPPALSPEALHMLMRGHAGQDTIPFRAFQYGGVVTRPTFGMLGEAGPEAVVPLGRQQPFGAPPQASMSPWGGGNFQNVVNQQRAPSAPFDPNNPYAGTYNKPLQNVPDISGYALRQWAMGGGLNPMGDPRITAGLRAQALQDATAQGRAARLGLLGRSDVDPSTFGFQSLMSDLQGQGQVANAMNQASLQQALAAQQFYRNLFGQQLGAELGERGAERGALLQRDIQRSLDPGGFDWGGLAGGLGKLAGGISGFIKKKD